jgi:hypothetical protein
MNKANLLSELINSPKKRITGELYTLIDEDLRTALIDLLSEKQPVVNQTVEELLEQTIAECKSAQEQPNYSIDSYRSYFEGRKTLAEELLSLLSVQQAYSQSDKEAADKYIEMVVKPECDKWKYDFNTSVYVLGASHLGFIAGLRHARQQPQQSKCNL